MLFAHTLSSPAADQRLLLLRMLASGRNFQPQASSSGFGSPVVPQCRRPGMPDAAAASRDPGPITGNSTGVLGPDLQAPTSRLALSAVEGTARSCNSFRMHTYEKRARKSFRMHSYKIIGLKESWNHSLPKKRGWGGWGIGLLHRRRSP